MHLASAQAADLFRSAIAADPKFAQAHASLAEVLLHQALEQIDEASNAGAGGRVDRAVMPDIERALAARPEERRRLFRQGSAPAKYTFGPAPRWPSGAPSSSIRATRGDAARSGGRRVARGRVDERHRLVVRARDLDPMDRTAHESAMTSAWILGRGDELRATVERMLSLFPDDPAAHMRPAGHGPSSARRTRPWPASSRCVPVFPANAEIR